MTIPQVGTKWVRIADGLLVEVTGHTPEKEYKKAMVLYRILVPKNNMKRGQSVAIHWCKRWKPARLQQHPFTGAGFLCTYDWPDGDEPSEPCGRPRGEHTS